jgi:hypothetical protein
MVRDASRILRTTSLSRGVKRAFQNAFVLKSKRRFPTVIDNRCATVLSIQFGPAPKDLRASAGKTRAKNGCYFLNRLPDT